MEEIGKALDYKSTVRYYPYIFPAEPLNLPLARLNPSLEPFEAY